MAGQLGKEIIYLMMLYLRQQNFMETCHCLERVSGLYFDQNYLDELILAGDIEEAENYLGGFTSMADDYPSTRIIFILKNLKFFEALDRGDKVRAIEIIRNDLSLFASTCPRIVEQALMLVQLENFRDVPRFAAYSQEAARRNAVNQIRRLIPQNPAFRGKLELPLWAALLQNELQLVAQLLEVRCLIVIIRRNNNNP